MYVPDGPRFRLRWLRPWSPARPDWIDDSAWVPDGERQLYAEAKSGLAGALAGLGSDECGTVLVPAYVPAGVVCAARAAGHDVRYYPVGGDLRLEVGAVERRIATVDPDVLLLVHYFGFADPATPELVGAARERGITVVEDCARAPFSRDPDGRLLGDRGDLSLFCLHKTLTAPHGGLLVARDVDLPEPEGSVPELRSAAVSAVVSAARVAGVRPALRRPEIAVSEAPSFDDVDETALRPRRPGPLSACALAKTDPEAVRAARLERYRALRSRLRSVDGLTVLTPPAHDGSCPYGVAVRARSREVRDSIFLGLHEAGLPANVLTWPLGYRADTTAQSPGATVLRNRMLVVPTHQQVPLAAMPEIASTASAAVRAIRTSPTEATGREAVAAPPGSSRN